MLRERRQAMQDRREALAREMLAEVRGDIVHADQKGALILATVGLVFGVVLTASFDGRLGIGGSWQGWEQISTWATILWWAGAAAAAGGCIFAGMCVWPRYRSNAERPARIEYWGDADWYPSLPAFQRAWQRNETSESRTLAQFWYLSRIVSRKYRFIRASMLLALAAGALLIAGAILDVQ